MSRTLRVAGWNLSVDDNPFKEFAEDHPNASDCTPNTAANGTTLSDHLLYLGSKTYSWHF